MVTRNIIEITPEKRLNNRGDKSLDSKKGIQRVDGRMRSVTQRKSA